MPSIVLSAENIKKRYGSTIAVDDASIDVKEGEILGLLGSNGAGKSTLAKILIGLERADSGKISYFGRPFEEQRAALKKIVSIVPQDPSFYGSFTVKENIEFFASLYGLWPREAARKAAELIDWLNLSKFAEKRAEFLSGGYQHLLNIACSLVNDPKIIFLDEPTVGLDPKMRQLLWSKINDLKARKKTIMLTTHYMDEAQELCDRVALMGNGKIVVIDTPENLIAKYGGKTIIILRLNKPVGLELMAQIKTTMKQSLTRCVQSNLIVAVGQAAVAESIVELSRYVKESGYEIRSSTVREPELEDVFLHLTGSMISGFA